MTSSSPPPGDRSAPAAKALIRESARARLADAGAPDALRTDIIPNFPGSADAAVLLRGSPEWDAAETVLCTPDDPIAPSLRLALADGKRVFQVVPALDAHNWLVEVDADLSPAEQVEASTNLTYLLERSRPMALSAVPHVDLVVLGSLAASVDGARVGKGRGYVDLEHAMLAEVGALDDATLLCTVLHSSGVLAAGAIEQEAFDAPIHLIATPAVLHRCRPADGFEPGLREDLLRHTGRDALPGIARFLDDRKP